MAKKTSKKFEDAILELENIINSLENGSITLEESIKKYKEGMDLAGHCLTVLKKAEQEIYVYEEESYKKSEGTEWE